MFGKEQSNESQQYGHFGQQGKLVAQNSLFL
jgi:hypothetical protein